jgi:uridine kinase
MVMTFDALAAAVLSRPARLGAVRLVAIDGPGGAGKTVFARRLAKALGDAPILETDDFASWDTRHKWWPRLEAEALEVLASGRAARFERSRWVPEQPVEWRAVEPAPVVILEGVSAGREAVRDRLSYLVWVETAPDVRLARGIERDGEAQRTDWETWMAEEDDFFSRDDVRSRADLIVDGNPSRKHDAAREFIRVS